LSDWTGHTLYSYPKRNYLTTIHFYAKFCEKMYANVCSIQNDNQLITALLQNEMRQVEEGEGKELVCRPCIKDQNRLKKIVINKKLYQFLLRTKKITSAPYRLQNSWRFSMYRFHGTWFMN
jgi:hypothetical protein